MTFKIKVEWGNNWVIEFYYIFFTLSNMAVIYIKVSLVLMWEQLNWIEV